jgi:hypothetical protein
MDMYLTGSMDEDTISNVVLNTGAHKFDSLTGLKSQTHFGKPHWKKDVFDPIKRAVLSEDWYEREISGVAKIGCFYCELLFLLCQAIAIKKLYMPAERINPCPVLFQVAPAHWPRLYRENVTTLLRTKSNLYFTKKDVSKNDLLRQR